MNLSPLNWWYSYTRWMDLKLLWPTFKKVARQRGMSLLDARGAFRIHTEYDPAWRALDFEKREHVITHLK